MEPGEVAATKPAPKIENVKVPATPPQLLQKIVAVSSKYTGSKFHEYLQQIE